MDDNSDKLYEEFLRIADNGDEAAARKFLTDNIMEFPQEVREKIVFAFFEEALAEKAAATRALSTVQEEGIEALRKIITEEKELDNQARIIELKDSLGSK